MKIIFFTFVDFKNDKTSGGVRRFIELVFGFQNLGHKSFVYHTGNKFFDSIGFSPLKKKYKFLPAMLNFYLSNFKKIINVSKTPVDNIITFEFPTAFPLVLFGSKNVVIFIRQDYIFCQQLKFVNSGVLKKALSHIYISILKYLEYYTLKRAKKVITQNNYDRSTLISRSSVNPSKIIIIPNNVNPSWTLNATKSIRSNNIRVIGFIGDINDPRKGFPLLYQAFKRISDEIPNLELLIAGSTKFEEDNIKSLGYFPHIDRFFEIIDILVVPSLTDSFPNVILEALNFEVPVIGSTSGGIPEILQSEYFLFKPDSDALYEKLKMIITENNYEKLQKELLSQKTRLTFNWPEKIAEILNK